MAPLSSKAGERGAHAGIERCETIHAESVVMFLQLFEQDDGLVDGLDQITGVAGDEFGRVAKLARDGAERPALGAKSVTI